MDNHRSGEHAQDKVFDPLSYRAALGSFATGVTVVCARAPDGTPVGVTANSFSSVSMDPPLVLWNLNRRALSLPVFEAAEHFVVHILADDQIDLAERFATRGLGDKFAGIEWDEGDGGAPLLRGVAARFECRAHAIHDGGDHRIFLGRVLRFGDDRRPALAFQRGAYASCEPHRSVRRDPRAGVQTKSPEDHEPVRRLLRA
jgi:flavin reductase (DIM6/NTAB) family NADH-FMN oxidoreductase RutF